MRNQTSGGRSPGSRRRPALLWLLLPYALFLGVLPLVNRVTPTVLGLPFLFFWMLLATLATPLAVWLARRGDRARGRI
ncbi:DUF3311 domain-containing protein [Streptomyces platensis]|uniref:DUF3311 domain-containing protein n=1 Tax=Streptomyces TaxID=1883 RepID=UPI002257D113|nr:MULTISPECIES: DUF3311 domain-containing protein [Streptomyces]MCX4634602.1 DUF3311 domain-containing protein [Streptomyces platensis]WJY38481.1 DUF3311 domain-containing protein [Streptomyces sp. P9-2B-2]WSI57535.1 DUF3311 domain-containing protein [Streptomyces platensis]WSW52385.1 DUF3311 domain-containing protein [Streptomyces platensis]WTI52401.1 DUF3311 domain-containing protein [Streptomyces platensis]